ncbi:MAG: HAMP domain-containing sensor histidine kinase [Actinomycetota bacterium]|nr:HAMP domain-containing sensor histidine kinase [Actinomycetota bacterium]
MTLRRRLIATMIVLVAAGLVAVDLLTSSALRSYLYGRADDQLSVATDTVVDYLHAAAAHGRPVTATALGQRVSAQVYVELLDGSGRVVLVRPSGTGAAVDPAPRLPAHLPVQPTARRGTSRGSYRPDSFAIDVPSAVRHGAAYRLLATAVPGGTLVVASQLTSLDATLSSLRTIEIGVSVGVVVALGALLTVLVRRGLRPLVTMAGDADAIAAGDLARRVSPTDMTSEIGRLGRALNGMLDEIEAAFAQRSRSEERLRRFVADASHELRTPLTTIRGYAELLRRDALESEEAAEVALVRIEDEAARMGVLVDDLLTLARLGEEPVPAQATVVDLAAVARDAVGDARLLDRSRRVALHGPDRVEVRGDEARVGRIVHNLVRNAVTHTPPGTAVDVTVGVEEPWGVLSVRDAGPGIPPDQATRIFDRFYRGTTARGSGGSGLGLFIVAALTQALGGAVGVDSTPGAGTTFTVRLPRPQAAASGPASAGTTTGTAATTTVSGAHEAEQARTMVTDHTGVTPR